MHEVVLFMTLRCKLWQST